MIKTLKYYAHQMSGASKSLQSKVLLVDKKWILIDKDGKQIQLIFRANQKVIVVVDGEIDDGSWEYISSERQLYISAGSFKWLLNECFVNDNLLILCADNEKDRYYAMINHSALNGIAPELYLDKVLSGEVLQVGGTALKLKDEKQLILLDDDPTTEISKLVKRRAKIIDHKTQKETHFGIFYDRSETIHIKNGIVSYIGFLKKVSTIDNRILQVESKVKDGRIRYGDIVYYNNEVLYEPFIITSNNIVYVLSCGIIQSHKFYISYKTSNGQVINVLQSSKNRISKGDKVRQNGKMCPDGKYKLEGKFSKVTVRYGEIV